jgi:hypothetical protein
MALPTSAFEQKVNTESTRATYCVVVPDFTPVATATDILSIVGLAGKIITLTSVRVTGSANTAGTQDIYLYKRTTIATGGAWNVQTALRYDTQDPVSTTLVKSYTANPAALGTGLLLRGEVMAIMAKTALGVPLIWDFANRGSKAPKIQGPTECFALNWGGNAVAAGTVLYITFEWTEE